MKQKLILTFLCLAAVFSAAQAQGRKALRINEVMVVNENNVVDDYGRHSAWIELFNSAYAPLEISKVYLTNDRSNPTKYPIPLGDVNTKIPKRQHIIFWADNRPNDGTFHTNFMLIPGQENYIAIYDADGKTLIDEVTIPADLAPNTTYARSVDGEGQWQVRDGLESDAYITPSSNNIIKSHNSKVEMFKEQDENGLGLTIIAMAIVFSALLVLSLCFLLISKIGAYVQRRNKMKSAPMAAAAAAAKGEDVHDSGEEIAAIVMALHEHLDKHDHESTILTLNKVRKAYSPWNSKIYNMRQLPQLKGQRH